MDINSYYLPDWPSSSNQLIAPILKSHQSKSAKSPRHVSISTKPHSPTNQFLQPTEREQIIRTLSARKSQGQIWNFKIKNRIDFLILANIIPNTIMQFVPRSNSAKPIKQKIFTKKKLSPRILPTIK